MVYPFDTKDKLAAFSYLHFRFVLMWRKNIGAKTAHKMLVKWTLAARLF
jgi:hypothetical protein